MSAQNGHALNGAAKLNGSKQQQENGQGKRVALQIQTAQSTDSFKVNWKTDSNISQQPYGIRHRISRILQRMAYLPVPPETNYLLRSQKNPAYGIFLVFLGLFLLLAVCVWFVVLFFVIFGSCETVKTISTINLTDNAQCTPVTLPTYGTLIMDTRGSWITEEKFQQDKSIWELHLLDYQSTREDFSNSTRDLMIQAEQISQEYMQNTDWVTRVQILAFTDNMTKEGIDNGKLKLNLNLDVTALSHDYSGFKDVFYDFSPFLQSGVISSDADQIQQMVQATEGCGFSAWSRTGGKSSGKQMTRFEKIGGLRHFGVFVPEDFSTAVIYVDDDCNKAVPANTSAASQAQKVFRNFNSVSIVTPGVSEDSEFMDIPGIPAVVNLGEFRWDMRQVMHLDFCNKYQSLCDTGNQQSMNGLYPVVQHPVSQQWGYKWQNFTVVPQFYTPQGCQCGQITNKNKACDLLLGMFLHVYRADDSYLTTYSLQLQTTGMINTRLVSSPPHCTSYSPSDNYPIQNVNISIPDNLETGFYDCTVDICMDILERLASAQLNDELLFIIMFVGILLISVYIYHRIHINARALVGGVHAGHDHVEEYHEGVWEKFSSFASQVFVSVLPEETGYVCSSRIIQVIFGAVLLLTSFAGFVFFIFYLNQCDVNYIVSETDQSNGDNKKCEEMLLTTSGQFMLDNSGLWDTQTGFNPSKAYWMLEFEQFEADEVGLANALQQVRQQIDELVDSVIGKNHIETTMRLLFNNIQVKGGRNGVIRVQPNMDLIPVNTWGVDQFIDLSSVLGRDESQQRVGQVQDQCNAWRNQRGNAQFVNQSPLGFYKFIYPDEMTGGFISGPLINDMCPAVDISQDPNVQGNLVSPYPAFFGAFESINDDGSLWYEFAIDARQSYALSFCNQFPQDCSLAIDENTKEIKRTSNTLQTTRDENGQWGYLWTTQQNPYSQNITFFVVPDIQPTFECFDNCNNDYYTNIECDQALVHMSHFYVYNKISSISIINQTYAPNSYVGTFSTLKGTTGKWNRRYSTDGPLQCQIKENLKFTPEAENIVNPFDPSKNLYDCEIKDCPSIFERLATAFGDVEFLFVGFIMIVLIVLVALIGFCASEEDLTEFIEVEQTKPVAIYLTQSASKLAEEAVKASQQSKKHVAPKPILQLEQTQSQMITTDPQHLQPQKSLTRARELNRHGIAQEVGLLFPAIQRVFELPVPENGHKVLVKRARRRILGFLFFLILAAAFGYMVVTYIQDCHKYRSLTLNPPEDRESAGCQASILSVSRQFFLDSSGRFDVEEDFDPSKSYWTISLDNYKADKEEFLEDLQNLTASVDGFLAGLQDEADDKHFLYILQEMFLYSKTIKGRNGTMTIQANIDLSSFMDNLLNFQPFSIHDPQTEEWKPQNTDNVDLAELNGIYDCNGTMIRQGFGRIYGEGRERFLATPGNGLEDFVAWNPNQCFNGTRSFDQFDGVVDPQDRSILEDYREMYYGLNKLLGSPPNNVNSTFYQQFEIRLPLEDLLMVDFCRRNFERCQEVISIDVIDIQNPLQEIGFDAPPFNQYYPIPINVSYIELSPKYIARTLKTDAVHLGNVNFSNPKRVDLGMIYQGGQNPNAMNRIQNFNALGLQPRSELSSIYTVIPSITPHTACFTCSASRQIGWEECQRAVELRLEFLEYYPTPPPFRQQFYQFGLLYAGFRTDGYFNRFLSRGDLCQPVSLGFENVDVLNLTVPYAAESGLFNCEIKMCKGFFEIVGDAFGNVQELFVLVSMILFVFFVYIEVCCLGKSV